MLTNHYMTQTNMHSDTYFTGKTYPKLDAFIQNSKGAEIFYLCSSNQYKTQRRFKQSIKERYSLVEGAKIITTKAKEYK